VLYSRRYEPQAQCCTAGVMNRKHSAVRQALRTASTVLYSRRYEPQAQCCTAGVTNRKHSAVRQALQTASTVLYSRRYELQAQCCMTAVTNRKHSAVRQALQTASTVLYSRRYEPQAQSVLWCWLQACDLQCNLPSLTAMSHSAGLQPQWASHLPNPFPDTTQNSCLQIPVSIFKSILQFLQSKWNSCMFPWLLLNVNHVSPQKNTSSVIYFCPGMKVCHIFHLFCVLTCTQHYWGTFFFYITLCNIIFHYAHLQECCKILPFN